jgi:redox-sensitive bicupin YhaK (pirin superfamily)
MDPLLTVIAPRTSEIADGFTVRRALPSSRRRMVGPFIFLDQMGPELLMAGRALDVPPHPHIGLATVTYLFDGELLHRDSIGVVQQIRPGELNWMTAGKGIAHSERTPPEMRAGGSRMFGIQAWVALPSRDEETTPSMVHHGDAELPVIEADGVRCRVIAGAMYGARSPVPTLSELFYVDAQLGEGSSLEFPADHEERAAFVAEGVVTVAEDGDARHEAGQLLVIRPGVAVTLCAASGPARLMLLGGAAMDGPRHIWWNFVSSSRERIEQAKEEWRRGRFDRVIGETEFIPLPGEQTGPVAYP